LSSKPVITSKSAKLSVFQAGGVFCPKLCTLSSKPFITSKSAKLSVFQAGGVFWQKCHKIVMVPDKNIIRRCVLANARK
jgi:hypothetical protein